MAHNPKASIVSRNAGLDAMFDPLNGGSLRIYDGTQPATAETAISTQVLLAQLPLNATFAPAASNATKTANAITSATAVATASGGATWASLVTSGGTRRQDLSVGTVGADVNMDSVAIQQDATVSCSSCVLTMAAG